MYLLQDYMQMPPLAFRWFCVVDIYLVQSYSRILANQSQQLFQFLANKKSTNGIKVVFELPSNFSIDSQDVCTNLAKQQLETLIWRCSHWSSQDKTKPLHSFLFEKGLGIFPPDNSRCSLEGKLEVICCC